MPSGGSKQFTASLLSEGAACSKVTVGSNYFVGKVNTHLDVLFVRIISAELPPSALERLLTLSCTWDLNRDLGVRCKQSDLVLVRSASRCSMLPGFGRTAQEPIEFKARPVMAADPPKARAHDHDGLPKG